MCTILFSLQPDSEWPLVVAANRDEFLARPTQPIHWWEDEPDVVAGRDLEGGGTWMGMHRNGRFAAVTNYREVGKERKDAPTRGFLVSNFLTGKMTPAEYGKWLEAHGSEYNGFNLLFGTTDDFWYYGNRAEKAMQLSPGVYGLSNALLDTPWPKVEWGKQELHKHLADYPESEPALLEMLNNTDTWPDDRLPETGVSLEWERLLSALCVVDSKYGTRTSSVLGINRNGNVKFTEHQQQNGATNGIEFDVIRQE